MMPDQLKHARLVLTQALVEDLRLKLSWRDTVAAVLNDMELEFRQQGIELNMRDHLNRDDAADRILDRLFPKAELDKVGVPLSAPPARKPRTLGVGERFYYPEAKKFGHILSVSKNTNMRIARVLYEDNVADTLPLLVLVEPP